MKTKIKKKVTYLSMAEFNRKYFTELPSEKAVESPEEAQALGTILAKESFAKVKIKPMK